MKNKSLLPKSVKFVKFVKLTSVIPTEQLLNKFNKILVGGAP